MILMAAAALAMLVANSPLAEAYRHLLHLEIGPTLTPGKRRMATERLSVRSERQISSRFSSR